jgi:hypothetical protein
MYIDFWKKFVERRDFFILYYPRSEHRFTQKARLYQWNRGYSTASKRFGDNSTGRLVYIFV